MAIDFILASAHLFCFRFAKIPDLFWGVYIIDVLCIIHYQKQSETFELHGVYLAEKASS